MKRRTWAGSKPRQRKTNTPVALGRFWEFWRGMLVSHAQHGGTTRYNMGSQSTPPRKRVAPEGFAYNRQGRLMAVR